MTVDPERSWRCVYPSSHCFRLSMGALDQNTEVRQTSDNNETDAKCRGERKEEEEEGEGEGKKEIPHRLCAVGVVGISSSLVCNKKRGSLRCGRRERRLKCLIIIFPRDIGLLRVCDALLPT